MIVERGSQRRVLEERTTEEGGKSPEVPLSFREAANAAAVKTAVMQRRIKRLEVPIVLVLAGRDKFLIETHCKKSCRKLLNVKHWVHKRRRSGIHRIEEPYHVRDGNG
jgi:hypothetical protein